MTRLRSRRSARRSAPRRKARSCRHGFRRHDRRSRRRCSMRAPSPRVPRVIGLCLGGEDFAAAPAATPTPDVLRYPKLLVHYAAKAEGKLSLRPAALDRRLCRSRRPRRGGSGGRAHGFDGATCVHPSAVPILNAAFSPSEAERDWAKRVLAAAAARDGPFELDGRMVDAAGDRPGPKAHRRGVVSCWAASPAPIRQAR